MRVPLYEEEMKYFYSNYKNYYYLPDEDTAIHKSVASYVDKKYRVQATPKIATRGSFPLTFPNGIFYFSLSLREATMTEIFSLN